MLPVKMPPAAPSGRHVLCTLFFACLVGTGAAILGKIEKAANDAKSLADAAIQGASDAFESTGQWVEGTWEDAGDAAEKAIAGVKTNIDEVGTIIEGALSDEEKVKKLLVIAFPKCSDMKHTITGALNATMTGTIEELLRLQKCTADVHSQACLEALQETFAFLMFNAVWYPLTMGVRTANPALNPALLVLKPAAQTLVEPIMLEAAAPMAKGVQEVLKGADLDLSTADDVLRDIKAALLGIKDDMLRATEARVDCLVVLPGIASSAYRRQVAAAFAVVSVPMLLAGTSVTPHLAC